MNDVTLLYGMDVIKGLKQIDTESVQCVVTSPPYWGLRNYGVSGQIGLEKTPSQFVERIVKSLRKIKRVLKNDGTLWINLGDSYAGSGKGGNGEGFDNNSSKGINSGNIPTGVKPKDLIGVPWRVAFALQADGWYLRSDIIWAKPNPMPESVLDRPTKAHEYIFLLSKSSRYFYNVDAIREPHSPETSARLDRGLSETNKWNTGAPGSTAHAISKPRLNKKKIPAGWHQGTRFRKEHPSESGSAGNGFKGHSGNFSADGRPLLHPLGRNRRTVWEISTEGYKDAHFATFPTEIPRICILAGSRPGDLVLDPFSGSGTTGEVAIKLGRRYIGIDLNKNYEQLAKNRIGLFAFA